MLLVVRQQQEGQGPEGGRDCVCLQHMVLSSGWTGLVHAAIVCGFAGDCMVFDQIDAWQGMDFVVLLDAELLACSFNLSDNH